MKKTLIGHTDSEGHQRNTEQTAWEFSKLIYCLFVDPLTWYIRTVDVVLEPDPGTFPSSPCAASCFQRLGGHMGKRVGKNTHATSGCFTIFEVLWWIFIVFLTTVWGICTRFIPLYLRVIWDPLFHVAIHWCVTQLLSCLSCSTLLLAQSLSANSILR